ncbi:glycosyltransferase family 2 protein [Rhodococcus sp. BH2-1]|nr:glycosyltransferase family 2 protein [Rhodococcus sp. BH2-1]
MIDVIVVAYKTQDVLPDCIDAILSDPDAGQVYVVNNSPEFPIGINPSDRVHILEPGENLGFGNGVNLARKHVSSDFVAIVNPDLVFTAGTLARCGEFLDGNPKVGLVSPRVFVGGQQFRSSEREASLLRYLSYPLGVGRWCGVERSARDHRRSHLTDAVNGAFMVARRQALDAVGWFDRDIFLFGEEIDLCRRLRSEGWLVAYLAEGQVNHRDGHSSDKEPRGDIQGLRRAARVEQLRRARGEIQAGIYGRMLKVKRSR